MTLVDAGPLVALINSNDEDHRRCVAAIDSLAEPLITSMAVVVEAMYFLGTKVGVDGQERLLRMLLRGDFEVVELTADHLGRALVLMRKYRDLPMDFADATLVVLAESLGTDAVFTFDSDFRTYRLKGRRAFRIVP